MQYILSADVFSLRGLVAVVAVFLSAFSAIRIYCFLRRVFHPLRRKMHKNQQLFCFFHPYCDNGGGGERVLWVAVAALLQQQQQHQLLGGSVGITSTTPSSEDSISSSSGTGDWHVVVYCGDCGRSKQQILTNVASRFGIHFSACEAASIDLVYIRSRSLLDAKWYPVCTMLFQSLGSLLVGLECLLRCPADVFCDTSGAAFCFPLARCCCGARVIAYVHYPIISTDMLQRVRLQRPSHNNSGGIAGSVTVSTLKVGYYRLFAAAYCFVGRFADVVMVNSSWTKAHIQQLWFSHRSDSSNGSNNSVSSSNRRDGIDTSGIKSCGSGFMTADKRMLRVVFPPCNTSALHQLSLQRDLSNYNNNNSSSRSGDNNISSNSCRLILSIGQFRPEKDHMLQISAIEELIKSDNSGKYSDVQLLIMGSTRNADDALLLRKLQQHVQQQQLQQHVRFEANCSQQQLQQRLQQALLGLHSMWNEHFGISIVEMQAAGLLVVAHRSGGPQADIIRDCRQCCCFSSDNNRNSENNISSSCECNISGSDIDYCQQGNGFLAETAAEYASALRCALDDFSLLLPVRAAARRDALRFSDENFRLDFLTCVSALPPPR